jgi:hypothetical protein
LLLNSLFNCQRPYLSFSQRTSRRQAGSGKLCFWLVPVNTFFQLFPSIPVSPCPEAGGANYAFVFPESTPFSTFPVSPVWTLPGGRRGKLGFRVPRVNTFFQLYFVEPGVGPARRQEGQAKRFASPRQHLSATFFRSLYSVLTVRYI